MNKLTKVIGWYDPRRFHYQLKLRHRAHLNLIANLASFLSLASVCYSQSQASLPTTPEASSHAETMNSSKTDRFDYLVRSDFFSGNNESLQRAMKTCEDALIKNPNNAPAMSWHGCGLLKLAGQSYQAGDYVKGGELWKSGVKEINDAVALQPDNLQVLIPRATTFLAIAKHVSDIEESKKLLSTAVTDFEKILNLQKHQGSFKTLPLHPRGELLSALAEGWYELGQTDKSIQYLRQIIHECAGSTYAKNAGAWLETIVEKVPNKPETLTCIGCHNR